MTAYSDAVGRLTGGYWNNGVRSLSNPGGFAGNGHYPNFIAALGDVGILFDQLDATLTLIGGATPAAAAAADSAAEALTYRNAAQTAKTDAETARDVAVAAGAAGKQTIPIPARYMRNRVTNGAQIGSEELAGNKMVLDYYSFSQSVSQGVQFAIAFPKSWNGGTVSFRIRAKHRATTVNFGWAMALKAVSIGNNEALDTAFGTAQQITDTGGVTGHNYLSAESAGITIPGAAAGELVLFDLYRVVADAFDDMNALLDVLQADIFITTIAGTDI